MIYRSHNLVDCIEIDRPAFIAVFVVVVEPHAYCAATGILAFRYWRNSKCASIWIAISAIAIKSHKHALAIYETISFEIYFMLARLWLLIEKSANFFESFFWRQWHSKRKLEEKMDRGRRAKEKDIENHTLQKKAIQAKTKKNIYFPYT